MNARNANRVCANWPSSCVTATETWRAVGEEQKRDRRQQVVPRFNAQAGGSTVQQLRAGDRRQQGSGVELLGGSGWGSMARVITEVLAA